MNYPLNEKLAVYAMVSAASYSGGFLDGAVESFHRTFGFERKGRPGVTRNRLNIFYDLKRLQYTELDRQSEQGLLDPVLGVRYAWLRRPGSIHLMLESAIKIPLGGDPFFSTGRVGVGAQASAQLFNGRHAFYASGALVHYAGSPAPFNDPSMLVPSVIVGYEYNWYPSASVIAQLHVSRSVNREKTDLEDLRATKYQASIGLRHRITRGYWSFAVTENVINFNNTPDIVFQFGVGFEL